MGNAASDGSTSAASIFDAAQTSALDKIVSEQSYMMSDSVWVTFFTLDQPLLDMPPATLQQFFRPYAHNFARNTVRSGNFRMLIRHVTRSVRYLSPPRHHADTIVTTTTTVLATESFHVINVLCVVRHFIKHFIEHNCEVVTLFATEGNSTSSSTDNDIAVDFLDALLLLLFDAPTNGGGNPFRNALATLADRDELSMMAHSLPFSHVVAVLGRNIHIELHATLLYHALLLNPSFRDALCRPVLPLLEAIYMHTLSPPRLYTLLAVLLHLSENPLVVQTLHQAQDHQTWYQERYLCDLSAASVGVLVLCRVLKANLSVLHDSLVQSMAMALLWNVMQFAKNLHPTATQSLVKLLAHAAKKEQLLRPSPDEAAAYLATARDLLLCIQLGCTPRLLPANAQLVFDVLNGLAMHPSEALRDDIAMVLGTVAYCRAMVDQGDDEGDGDDDGRMHDLTMEQVLERIQGGCKALAHSDDDVLEDIDFDDLDDHLEQFQQDDFIKEALAKGVDLRQYAQQIDRELREVEMESITQYVAKSADIVDLYNQVQSCDDILARMQEMLLGFQADLGGISDEIRNLQNESIGMNVKLRNRREAEEKLRLFLDQVYIPPTLIEGIDDGDVNDAYISYLMILHSKLAYAKLSQAAPTSLGIVPATAKAVQQVDGDLEKLKLRACAQIREWLLGRINDLKKPKTNVQMVQQTTLVKMKYVLFFLNDHAPSVASELTETYADTMSRVLVGVVKAYHTALFKFVDESAGRTDVVAVEEASLKASMFSSRVKPTNAFALGDRDKVVENAVAPPILVHMAQAEGGRWPYEALFRSTQVHLVNAATSEYLFLLDFFKAAEGSNPVRVRELFLRIFAKTLSLGLEQLENYLCTCYDAIGLLLMVRLTLQHQQVLQQRRVPVLDTYLNRVLLLLWPRVYAVLELNVQSVKTAKPKKLGNVELHPHYVTRRYAEFVASVLALVPDAAAAAGVYGHMAALRGALVELLDKLADSAHKTAKDKIVFLINNYDLVVSVVQERKIESDELFDELLTNSRDKFVEEELLSHYGPLIGFVQQAEAKQRTVGGGDATIPLDSAKVERIVKDFNGQWKRGIEHINANVMKFFSNFRNGMEILKQVLTQLLLYYTRFVDLVKKSWTRPPSFSNDIVTTQEILYEIKKYSRSF
ncbi:hypothetical protein DYB34_003639 [Aphanomyces astaci]|uniref:Vacuolar protein sorting-associated protein 52 homolog n=1 Tax=Aphanomyces astaci TaxID=112090 RepID=A0A3R6VST8_APHAT|nr:hypothetical protein DYB34_003639 [Aphanomyces astaci]